MAEIKDEPTDHHSLAAEEPHEPDVRNTKQLQSLDIFRGITVVMMILVDDAGGEWPVIAHAPWNGCNLADFVMPFFLFIVGMAIPLTFIGGEWPGMAILLSKTYFICRLAGIGIFVIYVSVLYGTYVPSWEFTVVDKTKPDYGKHFDVACHARGKLDPPCNAAGYIDRMVLGINHMYHHPAWTRSKA